MPSPKNTVSLKSLKSFFSRNRRGVSAGADPLKCEICSSLEDVLKEEDSFGNTVGYCSLCRAVGFSEESKTHFPDSLGQRHVTATEFARSIHWLKDEVLKTIEHSHGLAEEQGKPKVTNAIHNDHL